MIRNYMGNINNNVLSFDFCDYYICTIVKTNIKDKEGDLKCFNNI